MPVDGSEGSAQAVALAGELALSTGCTLDILHVSYFDSSTDSQADSWLPDEVAGDVGNRQQEVLDKAKSCYGRYYAVNLCNHNTIEFRLFRGTLKLNTLLATLQMVDRICSLAINHDDEDLQTLSWSEFVSHIEAPELIQYLKERRLYINEEINDEEDI